MQQASHVGGGGGGDSQSAIEAGCVVVIEHCVDTSGAGTGHHGDDILGHLRRNIDPVLPSTDDGFSIYGSEPELVTDSQPPSIGDPLPVHQSLPIGSVRYEVLHVPPRQGWTEKQRMWNYYIGLELGLGELAYSRG